MKLFYTDIFVLPLPPGHRFPMEKYSRLRQCLLDSGEFVAADMQPPPPASMEELQRAHDPAYIQRVCDGTLSSNEQKRIGFPWSPGMVERSLRSAGATLAACRTALAEGCSANLAGGTHHAHADRGEGFCIFNDAAVAARAMQAEGHVERVAIIDCDVHQGNGTAAILKGDDSIFTFSIHGARNFPFDKEASDLDIELPDGAEDTAYLAALDAGLDQMFRSIQPELVIYLAGADPYTGDRLGRLNISKAGLAERDRRVLGHCRQRGIPVAIAMAGGYAQPIDDTVAIHATTVLTAKQLFFS
ncbi:MAG: histone deacetylase [Gammaproteobacteria bacterium]|nr:histone deacetylase [Gammaproteobacteria bacterium]